MNLTLEQVVHASGEFIHEIDAADILSSVTKVEVSCERLVVISVDPVLFEALVSATSDDPSQDIFGLLSTAAIDLELLRVVLIEVFAIELWRECCGPS